MTTSSSQRAGPVSAPPEYRKLLMLTLISAALYLLNGIVSRIGNITHQKAAYESVDASSDSLDSYVGTLVWNSIIFLVLAMALYVLVYIGLKKGRSWGRTLGIILVIVSIIGAVFYSFDLVAIVLSQSEFVGSLILGVWSVVLIALGVVLGIAVFVVDILWLINAFKKPVVSWFAQQS